MEQWSREIFIDIEPDVRVRYCRSAPPPPFRYAVVLEILVEGEWTAIRLWDNAHALDEHHEHEYTRREGKKQPTLLKFASTNDAMASGIHKATAEWRAIVRQWERTE